MAQERKKIWKNVLFFYFREYIVTIFLSTEGENIAAIVVIWNERKMWMTFGELNMSKTGAETK